MEGLRKAFAMGGGRELGKSEEGRQISNYQKGGGFGRGEAQKKSFRGKEENECATRSPMRKQYYEEKGNALAHSL